MNITSFLLYCFIVTFTPGPTNIVILSTVHNFGTKKFKTNIGISPYQYYLNCKVEFAKKLIEKNKDVYSAVAECGFVDLTHLNKHFKSIYGVTAFEYMTYLS